MQAVEVTDPSDLAMRDSVKKCGGQGFGAGLKGSKCHKIHLDPSGSIWIHLDSSGFIWIHLDFIC